ncbi:nucleotidyltransferase domain-containing protein [Undibacterium sp. Rencai35W]|uniref:nucleotidyltransferase domain-containing protein n=1 Tax=Undibacterium sp. Rencai35W TaxID=3413046 RepID=UPI003BF04E0F
MKRDLPSLANRVPVSLESSARFFYLIDAIASHNEPTQTQLNALESSYRSTGDYLSECPEFVTLIQHIHPHGSRQLGTIIRPMDDTREGFDIDLVARLSNDAMRKYGGENGASLLLKNLGDVLSRYADAHGLGIRRWERCVTLEYAGGMCADIAPIIDDPLFSVPFGETHGRIPDRKLQNYNSTNPRGYAKYFDRAASISPQYIAMESFAKAFDSIRAEVIPLSNQEEVFNRLLSRLVQLLKLHRNLTFSGEKTGQDISPTSIFVTSLAAIGYTENAPLPHHSPLDLLLDIVEGMPNYFKRVVSPDGSEEWILSNPSALNDNLASGMNTAIRQKAFLWWHTKLLNDLREILNTIEQRLGMDMLLEKITTVFGERAAKAVEQDELNRLDKQRKAGRVAIFTAGAMPVSVKAKSHTFFGQQ